SDSLDRLVEVPGRRPENGCRPGIFPYKIASILEIGAWSAKAAAVELLDRLRRRRALALQPARDGLGLAPHAEHVLAGELAELFLGPSAPGQFREERRVLGHVLEPHWRVADPVEIGADPDVVDPGDLPDVLDVGDHVLHGRAG